MKKAIVFLAALLLLPITSTFAVTDPEQSLREVGAKPVLGAKINLDLKFKSSEGQERSLREFVTPGKPFIIVPAYYHCPRLCGLVLDGVAELIRTTDLALGTDYSIVTISFDSSDTVETASAKAAQMRSKISDKLVNLALVPEGDASEQTEGASSSAREPLGALTEPIAVAGANGGEPTRAQLKGEGGAAAAAQPIHPWQFLIGDAEAVGQVMTSLGFQYTKDGKDFSHAASIFIVSAEGQLSQYLAGIQYPAETVRYALVEAGRGEIGGLLDQVFLFCFRYDHLQGKYTWVAFNVMRVGGILTLSFLSILLYRLWYQEKRKRS